jgi:hypothetical protein
MMVTIQHNQPRKKLLELRRDPARDDCYTQNNVCFIMQQDILII